MSNTSTVPKPTLANLAREMAKIRERMEDMEDLLELRHAVDRNQGLPGVPWTKIKSTVIPNSK